MRAKAKTRNGGLFGAKGESSSTTQPTDRPEVGKGPVDDQEVHQPAARRVRGGVGGAQPPNRLAVERQAGHCPGWREAN